MTSNQIRKALIAEMSPFEGFTLRKLRGQDVYVTSSTNWQVEAHVYEGETLWCVVLNGEYAEASSFWEAWAKASKPKKQRK